MIDTHMDINMAFIESVTDMYSLCKNIRDLSFISGQVSIYFKYLKCAVLIFFHDPVRCLGKTWMKECWVGLDLVGFASSGGMFKLCECNYCQFIV